PLPAPGRGRARAGDSRGALLVPLPPGIADGERSTVGRAAPAGRGGRGRAPRAQLHAALVRREAGPARRATAGRAELRPQAPAQRWSRARAGSVGLFDMPGVPETSPAAAFIIRGWGSHNPMEREYTVFPADAASLLAERHPFRCGTEINYVSGDRVAELSRVG